MEIPVSPASSSTQKMAARIRFRRIFGSILKSTSMAIHFLRMALSSSAVICSMALLMALKSRGYSLLTPIDQANW